jgi:hypothetical protein
MKLSIGLRGWRFEEREVFDEDGQLRPLGEIPEDARYRLVRLQALLGEPCSACWIEHGEEGTEQCNPADVVYGEPLAEVLLCPDHEADFHYWFREAGGDAHAGSAELPEAFHDWFDAGNRAPAGYDGVEHVDEEPEELPDPLADGQADAGTDSPPPAGTGGADTADPAGAADGQTDALDETEQAAVGLDLDDLDV